MAVAKSDGWVENSWEAYYLTPPRSTELIDLGGLNMHRTPSTGGITARVMRGAALRRFVTVLTVLGMMLSFLPGGLSYPSASQAQEQGAG
ncbi:MAG: hypothetical protein OEY98_14430, partial [Acidimicrobiia bacterium]|nr:hypothetical protein [Acidimicrobiia bacterium]